MNMLEIPNRKAKKYTIHMTLKAGAVAALHVEYLPNIPPSLTEALCVHIGKIGFWKMMNMVLKTGLLSDNKIVSYGNIFDPWVNSPTFVTL